jgi:MFS family permease
VICDRVGRKAAIILATLLIVVGCILSTAAHGAGGSVYGLFWFLTVSRGMTGVGVGGEYPTASAAAGE